jgi:hypothetical protein
MILSNHVIEKLIQVEAGVHYSELPPPGREPFIFIDRQSPVIISAPHGAITYRNNRQEDWHEEDEYTAGMALLISELCKTSVLATIWRTADSDPNEHSQERSAYKRKLRNLVDTNCVKWLIDLHGTKEDRQNTGMVDLGTNHYQTIDKAYVIKFSDYIQKYLGADAVTEGIQATQEFRIVRFSKEHLNINAIQVEMKPSVRVANRRVDASSYGRLGPFQAQEKKLLGLMQAITDFIEHLKGLEQ